MSSYTVIDADGHILEPDIGLFDNYLEGPFKDLVPRKVAVPRQESRFLIEGQLRPKPYGKGRGYDLGHIREHTEASARLKDMDEEGVDIALLFPSWGLFFAGVENVDYAVALCRAYNSWIHDYANADPWRLRPLAVLPLQSVPEAVRELHRAVRELGIPGAVIPTASHGRNLDHPDFYPLWEAAQTLDVPLAVHTGAGAMPAPAGTDRFDNFFFTHLVSHPFEQMLALASVVAGGVLELFPTLRFGFVEAGVGYLPYWIERLDEHYELKRDLVPLIKRRPSEYIKSGCVYITCESEEEILPYALQVLGDDMVMYGSDFPHFDAAWPDSVRILERRQDISDEARRKILHDNAAKFYRITDAEARPAVRRAS